METLDDHQRGLQKAIQVVSLWMQDYKTLEGIKMTFEGNPQSASIVRSLSQSNSPPKRRRLSSSDSCTGKWSPTKNWQKWKLEGFDSDPTLAAAAAEAQRALDNCLEEPIMKTGSRTGTRSHTSGILAATSDDDGSGETETAAGETPPDSLTGSQPNTYPDSQQSVLSSQSFKVPGQGSARIGDDLARMSVLEGLNFLHKHRGVGKSGNSVLKELKHTHYVVNRLLDASFESLKSMASKKREHFSRMGKLCNDIDLHLYNGRRDSTQKLDRCPDNAFYLEGKQENSQNDNGEAAIKTFSKENATVGILVTVEQKTNLNDNAMLRKAHLELCRDFVTKLDPLDVRTTTFGYGIITDGIDWYFLRMEVDVFKEMVKTLASDRITILASEKKAGSFQADMSKLSKWLSFIVQRSVVERTTPRSFDFEHGREFEVLGGNFTLSEFVGNGRFTVVKGSFNQDIDRVVLKFPRTMQGLASRKKRLDAEWTNLEKCNIKNCGAIVNVISQQTRNPYLLALEDSGIALDKLIVGGVVGKTLAKAVKRDIWGKALGALGAESLVHADIHPGNICIMQDGDTLCATLVDFEGAVTNGRQLAQSPIKNRDDLANAGLMTENEKADHRQDKAAVAAVLHCLWEDGSFSGVVRWRLEFGKKMKKDSHFEPDVIGQIT